MGVVAKHTGNGVRGSLCWPEAGLACPLGSGSPDLVPGSLSSIAGPPAAATSLTPSGASLWATTPGIRAAAACRCRSPLVTRLWRGPCDAPSCIVASWGEACCPAGASASPVHGCSAPERAAAAAALAAFSAGSALCLLACAYCAEAGDVAPLSRLSWARADCARSQHTSSASSSIGSEPPTAAGAALLRPLQAAAVLVVPASPVLFTPGLAAATSGCASPRLRIGTSPAALISVRC